MTTKRLMVEGMTCGGCEVKIEKKVKALEGVTKVNASYNKSTVSVTFDNNITDLSKIKQVISKLGYNVSNNKLVNQSDNNLPQIVYISIIIFGIYMILNHLGAFTVFNYFPKAKEDASYAMLFVIGLLTSTHCIAMCGGINLSQCATLKKETTNKMIYSLKPSFLYNIGRVISYTAIGAIVGGLGSVISFSGVAKGVVAILAGVFMIIMGLNMLNIFPNLRNFNITLPKIFVNKTNDNNGPFYVGLLNGLMPCGPLQTMQLYALSTGDPIKGAISMFLFSLGTVPLMFGFGAISSLLSKKFTNKMMTASAVLVILLGFFMFSNGLSLSGVRVFRYSSVATNSEIQNQIQTVTMDVSPRSYEPIVVKKGIPVKWIINAEAQNINGCNNEIIVPKYNLSKPLEPGENIIEFTPTETGVIPYSCWMGMIRSTITVVE